MPSPSSASAFHPISSLNSASPYSFTSSSSLPHTALSRETDATARNDRVLARQALYPDSIQARTIGYPDSSYTQPDLPQSSSLSGSSSRNWTSQSPSSYPAASHVPPPSRSAAPIPISSSSSFHPAATTTLYAHSPETASLGASDMRNNATAFDATLPSSSFSPRRDASFARLRSASGSVYTPSRAAAAADAEVSINVLVWWPSTAKSASSTLARAPLFRDGGNVKSKLSMRSSPSHARSPEPGHEVLFERASFGFRNGGASWLREKPSKARLNAPSSSVGPLGQWKRAIFRFRENGSVSIFGEGSALTHTINCGALSASDVRSVDDSLFGRPHVLAVHPRQPRAPTGVSITTRRQETALVNERVQRPDPIFIAFKNEAQLQYAKTLLRIYVRPEIYGSTATIDGGGTHRFFRQLDITISDAKSIMPRWPAELSDAAPELSSASPSNHPLLPGHYSASPTSASAGANSTSSEFPRSLSHQLGNLRPEDQDDSPGSEPLTEDGLSGSSRAGSRSGSRPGSRLRHNAKPSVSSIRGHHDLDENAASGSSRPASRAASHYDSQSQAGDDASSNSEHMSGPLSGNAGASRFGAMGETASSASAGVSATSSLATASRATAQRRDDKDRFEKARFDRYCRIRLDGDLVARTSLSHSGASAFAVDKFQLRDVGDAKTLVFEVLHPTQKSSNSLSGSPSQTANKYILLGLVEIPIETLRRNEDVEGWFPIWSVSTFPVLTHQQSGSSPTAGDEDDGKVPIGFHRGVVGELSLSIRLHEGAVMPLSMYEEVYRRIHDEDAADVIRELATTMREERIISHLIRIYAASGTVAERIASLIESESVHWGEKMEPELLFRANTILSRSVDHFQRLLALSWLDDCLGPTVRKICQHPNPPGRTDTTLSGGSVGSGGTEEAHFDFSTSIRSPPLLPANALDAIPDGPMTTSSLRKLSETLWHSIYRQRHSCPPELRTVLHQIRRKVNERYRSTKSTRPGIQGVGAFVFLRLFCAALNAPQLYGLTPSQPGRAAQRKLLLLSKVLLALASKKTAFDKDKDKELVPLNDLLRTYSSAYDDYIIAVSTEPPTAVPVQLLGTRIEDDAELQAAAHRRLTSLSPLHREAIPKPPHMLDQPQALASFVCFIADAAEEHGQADALQGTSNGNTLGEAHQDYTAAASSASETEYAQAQTDTTKARQKAREFVQICCRIEEVAGMCIEQAGFDPKPIPFERLQRAAMAQASRYGVAAASSSFVSPPSRGEPDTSIPSFSSSTSSFGTVVVAGDGGAASPGSSPGQTRYRRATVSATNAQSRIADSAHVHKGTLERNDSGLHGTSPTGARRKSFGLPIASQRPSQATNNHTPVYESGADHVDGVLEGKGTSELGRSHSTTPRQPISARAHPTSAVSSPYRHTLASHGDEEDEHGSDNELRQAYMLLRAEEQATQTSAQTVKVASGMAAIDLATAEGPPSFGANGQETQPSESGPHTSAATLEAEDGSTFESVYPQRVFTSPAATGPPLSRSARQSIELARPAGQQSMMVISPTPFSQDNHQAVESGTPAIQDHGEQVASRSLGSRASFIVAPNARSVATVSAEESSNDAAMNRRHSSDHPIAPRNYSLPQPPAGRKSSTQYDMRESSDGFGPMMEDAYAQTRASLPPSASMPVTMSGAAASSARYGQGVSSAVEAGQGKKKKWWKP